jgi:alpha-L-fucosidase
MPKEKSRNLIVRLSIAAALLGLCGRSVYAEEEAVPSWDSLQKHPVPAWPADAKFGICVVWGVYSVPAFDNEWYPRNMYIEDHEVYRHHAATYGEPAVFGYKDFIPRFTAEQFDAEAWADLMVRAGARFGGLVAEHQDGFSMWDSRINRWNAAAMGPRRDVVGELTGAIRGRNLKVLTSFHHAGNIHGYYPEKEGWDTMDPQYGDLYGKFTDPALALGRWLGKVQEVVDQYQPDQIWFDSGLGRIADEYRRRMAAYYYGRQAALGQEGILSCNTDELPEGAGIRNMEQVQMERPAPFLWQTEQSIAENTRCYTDSMRLRTAGELIRGLINVVSKNGILLLSICPKADGSIPSDQQDLLREIGDWLKINGEAIYGSRPWVIHGEGPNLNSGGRSGSERADESIRFTNQDIRFTAKGDVFYLIVLDWPSREVVPESLKVRSLGPESNITMLGFSKKLDYEIHPGRELHVAIPALQPEERPCRYAYVLKMEGFAAEVNPFVLPDSISLGPGQAVFEGERIRVETKLGRECISFWEDPKEQVHWLMRVRKPGRYQVRGEFSAGMGPSQVMLETETEKLRIMIPRTSNWESTRFVNLGEFAFARPGVYHLTLRAADIRNWRPLNVYRLQFAPP